LGLLQEAPTGDGFLIDRTQQKLDGHGAPEFGVFGLVDLTHTTTVNLTHQSVMQEHSLWRRRIH